MKELDLFLKELTSYYESHTIAPGLQFAWLMDQGKFYVAVHIFPGGLASRKVHVKATEESLEAAIQTCRTIWLGIKAAEEKARADNARSQQ